MNLALLRLPAVFALGLSLALTACDSPRRRALGELSRAGVEATPAAMADAIRRGDDRRTGLLLDAGVPAGPAELRLAVEAGGGETLARLLAAGAPATAEHLALAVERDAAAIAGQLVAAGAPPAGKMPEGARILPWAIRHGRSASALEMLAAGADPGMTDETGAGLLEIAIGAGQPAIARDLLDRGVPAGAPAFALALDRRLLELLAPLARAGAAADAVAADGRTPLLAAVAARDGELISALLAAGADPHRKAADGTTPLGHAFAADDAPTFRAFLDHGVRPETGGWDRWLRHALESRRPQAAVALLSRGVRDDRLIESAVAARAADFVKILADFGSPTGPALHLACRRGDRDLADLLIACGAPVDFTAVPTLDTPLAAALRGRHDKLAARLVRAGAALDLPTPEGQAPLVLAAAGGCTATLRALLERGVPPDTPISQPVDPAFVKQVRPGVVRWLLRHDSGVTPLMLAADSGVIPAARELIRGGAKLNARTRKTGIWPINFASRRDDIAMMRLFLGRDPQREERKIVVRLSEQRARVYDATGAEIFATRVSTGKKGHDTPTGEFVITNKYRAWKSTLYDDASMPYFQRLSCGDFGLHAGNVPGYPASHGCIRLPAENARKLFAMTKSGDRVAIVP